MTPHLRPCGPARDPRRIAVHARLVEWTGYVLLAVLLACAACNDPAAPPVPPPKQPSELDTLLRAATVTGDAMLAVSRTVETEATLDGASWVARIADDAASEQPNALALHGLGRAALLLRHTMSPGSILDVSGAAIDQLLTRAPNTAAGGPLTRWLPCARFELTLAHQITEPSPPLARITMTYPANVTAGCPFAGTLIFEVRTAADGTGTALELTTRWPDVLTESLPLQDQLRFASGGSITFTLHLDDSHRVAGFDLAADFCVDSHCFEQAALAVRQSVTPAIVDRLVRPPPCPSCANFYGDSRLDGLRDGSRGLDLGLTEQTLDVAVGGGLRLPSGRQVSLGDGVDPLSLRVGAMRNEAFVELEGSASYHQRFAAAASMVSFAGGDGTGGLLVVDTRDGLRISGCVTRSAGADVKQTCFDRVVLSASVDGQPPQVTLHIDGPLQLSEAATALVFSAATLQVSGSSATISGGISATTDDDTRSASLDGLTVTRDDQTITVAGAATIDAPRGGGTVTFCPGTTVTGAASMLVFDGCVALADAGSLSAVGSTTAPFHAELAPEGTTRLQGPIYTIEGSMRLQGVQLATVGTGQAAGTTRRLLLGTLVAEGVDAGATLELGDGIQVVATEAVQTTSAVASGIVQVTLRVDDLSTSGSISLQSVTAVRSWQAIGRQLGIDLSGDVDLVFADLTPEGEPLRVTFGDTAGPLTVTNHLDASGAQTIDGFTRLCFGCGGDTPAPLDLVSEQLRVPGRDACVKQRPNGGRLTVSGRFLEDRATLAALAAGVPPICVTCECNDGFAGNDLLYATSATIEFLEMTPDNGVAKVVSGRGFCFDDRGELDADHVTRCSGDGIIVFEPVRCD